MKWIALIFIWMVCFAASAADETNIVTEIRGDNPGDNSYANPWFATRFYIHIDVAFDFGRVSVASFHIVKDGFRQATTRNWVFRDIKHVAHYEDSKDIVITCQDDSVISWNFETHKLTIEERGFKTFNLNTVAKNISRREWYEKWRHVMNKSEHPVDSYFGTGRNDQQALTRSCADTVENKSIKLLPRVAE